MMKLSYTKAFKEQAVEKVLQRGDKTIQTIADELNVNHYTLKNWLKTYRRKSMSKTPMNKRPEDQSTADRFQLLMESSVLEGEALNAFCRQKGIFTHQLEAWKKAFLLPQQTGTKTASERVLRDQVKRLEKYLKSNLGTQLYNWRQSIEQFNLAYRDIEDGYYYDLIYDPKFGLKLHLNGVQLAILEDAGIGLAYFNIWFGKEPFSENLKHALLTTDNF